MLKKLLLNLVCQYEEYENKGHGIHGSYHFMGRCVAFLYTNGELWHDWHQVDTVGYNEV